MKKEDVNLAGNIYKVKKNYVAESDYILIIEDDHTKLTFLELDTGQYKELWYEQLVRFYTKVA